MGGRLERAAGHNAYARYREAFLSARRLSAGACLPAYPRVAIYTGEGASHSWTWFADLLERIGLYDVTFTNGCPDGKAGRVDALFVGGGDTYAIASSLGPAGAAAIERFVRDGGFYYGSCAGAYLVLEGVDREPFAPFRLVPGSMRNVMKDPPAARCLEHKYLAPYGEQWVFHPVYGEVLLTPGPASSRYGGFPAGGRVTAPLFGGPVVTGAPASSVIAAYTGAAGRAAFLWPEQEASGLMRGMAAVVASSPGSGTAVASGPHLEHPMFPEANAVVAGALLAHVEAAGDTVRGGGPAAGRGRVTERSGAGRPGALLEIRRQVSNSRIVGYGLERMPVTWKIGIKVWEPEKVRMFLEVAWRRLDYLERESRRAPAATLEELAGGYAGVTKAVKSLKIKVESGEDSQAEAFALLSTLKELTATFLALYFRLRLEE